MERQEQAINGSGGNIEQRLHALEIAQAAHAAAKAAEGQARHGV
jgi:hypothetical protein